MYQLLIRVQNHVQHVALSLLLLPLLALEKRIGEMAMQRLKFEELDKEKEIIDPSKRSLHDMRSARRLTRDCRWPVLQQRAWFCNGPLHVLSVL